MGPRPDVRILQRWRPTSGAARTVSDSADVRCEKLLGALLAQLPPETIPIGASTQAATAWVVQNEVHRSPDCLVRRDVASSIGKLAMETRSNRATLTRLAWPLLSLLDDEEPAVRAEAWASFDFLASQATNGQAHAEALIVVEALCARNVNLDMQSARRWECLTALGRQKEAEEAWQTCRQLSAGDRLVPRFGSRTHCGFEPWRKAREAMLASKR